MSELTIPSTEPAIDDWATDVALSWIPDPQHASMQRQLEHKKNVDRLAARIRKAGEKRAAALLKAVRDLRAALQNAVNAAAHVVRTCEADLEAGASPSPFRKSNPNGVMAECYGAMAFAREANAALSATAEWAERDSTQ